MSIQEIADIIVERLTVEKEIVKSQFDDSKASIGYFFIDNLLPLELAKMCFEVFPDDHEMRLLKSMREYKLISAQMNKHNPILEKVIYAFQDSRVVELVGEICDIEQLEPDEYLYAGGISKMNQNHFLNPHLDNSHDAERSRWRVLNLLFYVSPNLTLQDGGHLELWPNGPKQEPVVIESKFNRLVVMATHSKSWHSVNEITANKSRCCISNYYFSDHPLRKNDQFHVTKFRGRPNQTWTNLVLDLDASLRMLVRKVFKKGVRENPHVYKKNK